MDIELTKEDEAFRAEVRQFIAQKLPKELAERDTVGAAAERGALKNWQKVLYNKGWVAVNWPKQFGGTGWTPMQKHIFNEEMASANAPRLSPFGLSMVGPVIYTFGNQEQKNQHLGGILSGDVWWCQGYSEPGSGSDLASLKTKAVRQGDHYIVNGQKIWTSYAHEADWIFGLVRTDETVKQQEGISFLLIDMKTPGIEVKPIISIDGLHHLNEVFFTDVKVPVTNRIGEENKGWTYAKFLLVNERTGIAGVPESKRKIAHIKEIARKERLGDGAMLTEDQGFMARLFEVEVKLTGLEYTNLRIIAEEVAGRSAGPFSSTLKIVGTEVQQALSELAVEAVAFYSMPFQKEHLIGTANEAPVGPGYAVSVTSAYNFGRAASIYGGSNEIQRNVIAKAVLGL
tara:strand:- start:41752 stop:42951 length:1200 start_codon:yes stop_codon:yes gene_type:complete